MGEHQERLAAGRYRAVTRLVLSLMQGRRQVSYVEHEAGEEFEVPRHVNGFWSAVTSYDDLDGDTPDWLASPRYERLEAATR